jgi:phosphoserine phosphatase
VAKSVNTRIPDEHTLFPRGFSTIIFDCDSTLSAVEGIDELAQAERAEVAKLTEAAMRGELALEDVYGKRLRIIRPTKQRVEALGRLYVERVVDGAAEVCRALIDAGRDVRVVSGGLQPAVLHLARHLGIPDSRVAAVEIYFDDSGNYAGYDVHSPLARSGGKLALLQAWLPELAKPVMMVGDGATDLEVKPAVDFFVAYAGVVARPNVIAAADFVIHSRSLSPILSLATGN